jgi:23S rRNA pseudouridine2605 synthase
MASGPLQVRLQKVLARAGVASRRAAEELIAAGRVRVDGRVITELGTKVDPRSSRVEVDGQRIARESPVYIVLHKPRGTVSTMHDPEGRPTVRELFADVPARVYPVGRLDFNTSGVLFATNDGDFAEGLMHPRRLVPKAYIVKVQGAMRPGDLDGWRRGVTLEDGKTQPAKAKLLRHEADKTWIELTITEGRNQQVRRMGDATGFRVMRLARTAFAGVGCEGLRPGEWRYLSADELAILKKEYGVPKRVVSPPQEDARSHPRRAIGRPASQERPTEGQPRYGGGAPARRDRTGLGDWGGGGIRRGSSGERDDDRGPPEVELSGRARFSRTTGTGGGIGAERAGRYRLRGR